ncbi:hypothetical protein [Lentzea sp. NPDC004782]
MVAQLAATRERPRPAHARSVPTGAGPETHRRARDATPFVRFS